MKLTIPVGFAISAIIFSIALSLLFLEVLHMPLLETCIACFAIGTLYGLWYSPLYRKVRRTFR